MQKAADKTNYFFVDEAGDPVFYDKWDNLIVGNKGKNYSDKELEKIIFVLPDYKSQIH